LFEAFIQVEANTQLLFPDCDADVTDSHPHAQIAFVDGEGEKRIQ